MMRPALLVAMLAMCLIALLCTASENGDPSAPSPVSVKPGAPTADPLGADGAALEAAPSAALGSGPSEAGARGLASNAGTSQSGGGSGINAAPSADPGPDEPAAEQPETTVAPGTGSSGSSSSSSSSSSSASSVVDVVNKSAEGDNSASSAGGVGKPPSTHLNSAPDPQSGAHSSSSTVSDPPSTGNNLDGSHAPERPAVTTDGTNGSIGSGSSAGSTINTPTGRGATNTPLVSGGVPLSSSPALPSTAGSGGSSTQSGLGRDTSDGITDSASHKTADINKDRSQDNGGNQGKTDASQNQGNTGSLPTSSTHTGANKQTQEHNVSPASKLQKQTEEDTSTSEDVYKNGDTKNNNKQQTGGQGNAGTPTDPKTVSNVPSNKDATKTPKPEPGIPTGTESKMNSTTTTTMTEDVQSKSDANETSKTPTTTLAKQTKTLEQLQTLDTKDGTSSTPLIFAFSTLVTLALVSVVPVY